jgi:hypothetical protein
MYEGAHDQDTSNASTPETRNRNGNSGGDSVRPAHRQVHAAHDRYFEELTEAWNDMMEEFQTLQTDLARAAERAVAEQDAASFQKAQGDFQRLCQETSMNQDLRDKFTGAFSHYKESVIKALADADVEELGFTDLTLISQSLAMVAQTAMMMTMSMPANPLAGKSGRKESW